MKALLDTCVISELVARQPNPGVIAFVDALDPEDVYLSVITIGEIVKGIEKLPESQRKADLQTWLDENLLPRFDGHIVPLDLHTLTVWGKLTARLDALGKPMPAIDSLLAASALANKMTIITRNSADFEFAAIEMINPWK
jgi:toxin FitB